MKIAFREEKEQKMEVEYNVNSCDYVNLIGLKGKLG